VLFLECAHISQELRVGACQKALAPQQLDSLGRGERPEHMAQDPNAGQVVRWNKQFFVSRVRPMDIDCREDAVPWQLWSPARFLGRRRFS